MDRFSRRQFLSRSSAAVAAVSAGISIPGAGWAQSDKKEQPQIRTLGRTGLKVTQVSFGGLQIGSPALLNAAIDEGINFIHVGTGYQNGKSIQFYGEVMKTRRDEVVLALKHNPQEGIDEPLKMLNTDHVDILIPGIHSLEEINNPELPGAFEKLKKEGKIRFTGLAIHKNMAEVANRAIELGFFDVVKPAYNVLNREEMDPVLEKAKKEQNMGIMAMKVLRGLKRQDLTPEIAKGMFAELLKNKNVDTLLMGMKSYEDLSANMEACCQNYAQASPEGLDEMIRYAKANECSSCGACDACPNGVAVCDILRFDHYRERGEQDLALASYRELHPAQRADRCQDCGQCSEVCPIRLDVPARLRQAHTAITALA
ncbi:MAG: aldo/keto reductase [bacterium]